MGPVWSSCLEIETVEDEVLLVDEDAIVRFDVRFSVGDFVRLSVDDLAAGCLRLGAM
jgi:hypothetical protein